MQENYSSYISQKSPIFAKNFQLESFQMKKICSIWLLLFAIILNLNAQGYDKNCYYGFTFEVSQNPSWGYGELVITAVEPNSPAERAGIKVGDIIMEINGKATYLRDNPTIASWLFDNHDPLVKFTIRNMNTYFKEYDLLRNCISVNSVSEKDLSTIFSFYSLENTNQRSFKLPLFVEPNKEVDFADYHSYDFYKDGKPVPAIDAHITALLEKELQAKGLVRDTKDPDIIVQAYYNYEANPRFSGLNNNPNYAPGSWRFSKEKQQMVLLPIFDINEKNLENISQYIIEYGFSFYDRKYINTKKLTQIWDCSIKDYLSANYPLEEYVKFHTPLMLMQFPYATQKTEAEYIVDFNRYNYTGLYFDSEDLVTIKDVAPASPAFAAGIREGYVIKKINNKKFDHTKESLSEGYKRFISETMVFRDQRTRFTNAQGFNECMFWNIGYYPEITKEFNKHFYVTNFSYLYDFEKYVNSKSSNTIVIEAWDGIQMRLFHVTPEIRKSVVVKAI